MAKFLAFILLFAVLTNSQAAKAGDGKEFFTTVVYGTVAGALVGVATLAFASSPGDNLMNIARGASLGLYTGIILGTYLYYQSDEPPQGTINPDGLPPSDSDAPQSKKEKSKQDPLYGFAVYPTVQKGNVGVGVHLLSLNF